MSEPVTSLPEQMLAELQVQTGLLRQIASNQVVLIQALAEDQDEGLDSAPLTYMDGTPCR